jgi:2-polyprenyl-3-methyl-5-hydroxy-6-metoxy-1,4-benzoquinol methylase
MTTHRTTSHGQERETILESFLRSYRHAATLGFLKKHSSQNTIHGLDIGCGYYGAFVNKANTLENVHFVGCDLSVNEADKNLFVSDVFDLHLKTDNQFDVIVLHAVLEHVENPKALLLSMLTIMNKSGHIIMTFPSPKAKRILEFLSFTLGIISKIEIEDHKNYWNRETFAQYLKQKSIPLSIKKHHYFQWYCNNWFLLVPQ